MPGSTSSHLGNSLISYESFGGMSVPKDSGETTWADVEDTFEAVVGNDGTEDNHIVVCMDHCSLDSRYDGSTLEPDGIAAVGSHDTVVLDTDAGTGGDLLEVAACHSR